MAMTRPDGGGAQYSKLVNLLSMGVMSVRIFRRKRHEIGILFDIDALGGGLYGREAYRIIFNRLDPQQIRGSLVYDGDTNATLTGYARLYCIAVQVTDPLKLDYIRGALGDCTDKGLLDPHLRFIEGKITSHEPLVLAGGIDQSGVFGVQADDMVQASVL